MSFMATFFRTKLINDDAQPDSLKKCLSATDLTMLGIGAIIGAGIFVLTGIAAATQAGPAIIISYLLASIACGFSALSYAELAASVGGCGSAYGYAYVGLGELIAWIIGWNLLLEYGMDCATVSIGWSGYVQDALQALGYPLPNKLVYGPYQGGIINLPAVAIILLLAFLLSVGTKESSRFNKIIVYIKLAAITVFISIATMHFNTNNWHPFMPFGMQGIVNGAGLIFFAYIGFDAVSTAAEETIKPQRDLPIGIIASLVICTVLYVIVAGLLTGIAHYTQLNVNSPVSFALLRLGYHFAAEIVAVGAIAGLTTVMLVMYYGFTRVFLAMSRDGLLPKSLVKIHPRSQTPRRLILMTGVIMALIAGLLPIKDVAALVNLGTLSAFMIVSLGVLVLRKTKPNLPRPFKVPGSPITPIIAVILCFYLMLSLPAITWISFAVWASAGLLIYFCYGKHHSVIGKSHN